MTTLTNPMPAGFWFGNTAPAGLAGFMTRDEVHAAAAEAERIVTATIAAMPTGRRPPRPTAHTKQPDRATRQPNPDDLLYLKAWGTPPPTDTSAPLATGRTDQLTDEQLYDKAWPTT